MAVKTTVGTVRKRFAIFARSSIKVSLVYLLNKRRARGELAEFSFSGSIAVSAMIGEGTCASPHRSLAELSLSGRTSVSATIGEGICASSHRSLAELSLSGRISVSATIGGDGDDGAAMIGDRDRDRRLLSRFETIGGRPFAPRGGG